MTQKIWFAKFHTTYQGTKRETLVDNATAAGPEAR